MHSPINRPIPITALVALFLSGFASLIYELCWIKKAALIFGASAPAVSTVVALFFGGLALGARFSGNRAGTISSPLRICAYIEFGIALLASVSPMLFHGLQSIFANVYPFFWDKFFLLLLIRALLCAVVVVPPALLMGATFPLFCQYVSNKTTSVSVPVELLYALNTLGAALGTVVCGIWMLPKLGMNGSIGLGALISLLASILLLKIVCEKEILDTMVSSKKVSESVNRLSYSVRTIFFITGFAVLGCEILWARFLSLLVRNTVYTGMITLTVMLLGMAVGSVVLHILKKKINNPVLIFTQLQLVMGTSVVITLLLPPSMWSFADQSQALFPQWALCMAILFIPALLAGASFPLAFHMIPRCQDDVGQAMGTLTLFNTTGGILGSLFTGFIFLPYLGMHKSLLILTGCFMVSGLLAYTLVNPERRRFWTSAGIVVMILIWFLWPLLGKSTLPSVLITKNRTVLELKEGMSSLLAVVRHEKDTILEIDRMWQGERSMGHQVMVAHLPMLLHPNPKEVLVVGLGTGQTANSFLKYDLRRMDCVDIESALPGLINRWFEGSWLNDPRARIIIEDGRSFTAYSKNSYDIISIEVGQTFRPQIASFYTTNFYRQLLPKLKKDALVCQFVPLGFLTEREFRSVVASFVSVFPQSTLWFNRFTEFILIGGLEEQPLLRDKRLALLNNGTKLHQALAFSYRGDSGMALNQKEVLAASCFLGPKGLKDLAQKAELLDDAKPWFEYSTATHPFSRPVYLDSIYNRLVDLQTIVERPLSDSLLKIARLIQRNNVYD